MFNLNQILNSQVFGNSVANYLIVLGVFIVIIAVLRMFKSVIVQKIKSIAKGTETQFDDLLIKIIDSVGLPFYFVLAIYISFQFISLPDIVIRIVLYAFLITFAYYIVKAIQQVIDFGVERINQKMIKEEGSKFDPSVIKLFAKIVKGIVWGIAIILLIQNFGYDVTALVAGLGIGGIAIAFALQNILEDIFSSFSIHFDKPFQVDDFIIIGNDMGTVKKIGIKSTRIQTLQGEELIVSNKELTGARIRNFKKMEKRRIVFKLGVAYETSFEKLRRIPDMIKEIINEMNLVELNRVHFTNFGDSSLDFEVVYYLNSNEYNEYMDIQEKINFSIKDRFDKEGIEMAYPTQTIYYKSNNVPH